MREVIYRGESVQISEDEYYIMAKRGHLQFCYGMTSRVKPEPCLELRDVLLSKKI